MGRYEKEEIDRILEDRKQNGQLEDPKECNHSSVVREYYLGAHVDYACLDCGKQSTNRQHFSKEN